MGGGADEAGWVDELDTEIAFLQGFQVGGGLVDLAKFYEQVGMPELVAQAKALNYPVRLLALAVEAYSGPRLLTLDRGIHGGLLQSGGVLPGCGQAVSVSRAHLRAPLAATHAVHYAAHTRQWVDDIAFRVFGGRLL